MPRGTKPRPHHVSGPEPTLADLFVVLSVAFAALDDRRQYFYRQLACVNVWTR